MRIRREYRPDDRACLHALLRLLQHRSVVIIGDPASTSTDSPIEAADQHRGDASPSLGGVR
jgi:hypothetical protein